MEEHISYQLPQPEFMKDYIRHHREDFQEIPDRPLGSKVQNYTEKINRNVDDDQLRHGRFVFKAVAERRPATEISSINHDLIARSL